MITLDYIISDHNGAGRKAMQAICDYADLTGQIVFLNVESHLPEYGIEGSDEKDADLVEFYKGFGFDMSDRAYEWEGVIDYFPNMERKPNDCAATIRVRCDGVSPDAY